MELKPSQIPSEVSRVTKTLEEAGYEAYVVGGCVRDLLLGRKPKDWDVTTNATPDDIQRLFEHTYYTNEFGTVGVVNDDAENEALKIVEVTPYRLEGSYSDARRPDNVTFSQNIEDDLKRRDFTINALAYNASQGRLIDLYDGVKDISSGVVRAVGDARLRFDEDALRILRAVRLSAQLGFEIEERTGKAITNAAPQLEKISEERIRDEFVRIIESDSPMQALITAKNLGILGYIIPELLDGVGVEQNQAHSYDVWEHNIRSAQHAADKKWPFTVRLAALLHDIGKPATRRRDNTKGDWTFHGHDVVGAKMTKKRLKELKFPKEIVDIVSTLVRWHMFFSDPDQVTLSAVRRIIVNVGREHIDELIQLRICDRIGTGRPKEQPFRLRKYQAMIDEALRDPITVGMLKLDGKGLMETTGEKPGPRLGWMLHALLEEVLDDPEKNTVEYLSGRSQEMAKLTDEELRPLGEAGKEKQAEVEEAEIKDIHKKHFVD
ncbi:CCA tRNA nucleotidyltransferase [Candidatus Nomurabacteria bacterium]|nr:CCA tRNA nucleotidyltransferase [Candidatus Nomurabacteria bacterium]